MPDQRLALGTGLLQHPCFHAEAKGRYGRIHLPVAPSCNIQCRYCNRVYDCTNESRPGVTSRVLEPEEALTHLDAALARMPHISVVGIAGPGDSLADPERTFATLELIRRAHPGIHLCLSTNGLVAAEHVETLVDLDVRYVTVTVNAVDPRIGERITKWVSKGQARLRGREAAAYLIHRQMETIGALKSMGRVVKVNTVVIPGVNETHAMAVAETVSRLKVDLHNLIALIPAAGTEFCDTSPPPPGLMNALRDGAESFLPQMRHCARCRSDAAGLLHEDQLGGTRCGGDAAGWLDVGRPTIGTSGFHARQPGR
jgi:nitrogen fixation protein NifB